MYCHDDVAWSDDIATMRVIVFPNKSPVFMIEKYETFDNDNLFINNNNRRCITFL